MRRQTGSAEAWKAGDGGVASYFFTNVFCDLGQIVWSVWKHLALSERSLAMQGGERKTGPEETLAVDHLPRARHCAGWLGSLFKKAGGKNYPHVTDEETEAQRQSIPTARKWRRQNVDSGLPDSVVKFPYTPDLPLCYFQEAQTRWYYNLIVTSKTHSKTHSKTRELHIQIREGQLSCT